MEPEGNEPHFETDEARGGSTPHIVRWILAISLFGAIALLSIIWITGAVSQRGAEEDANVAARVQEQREAAEAEGILGEDADEIEAAEPGREDAPGVPTIDN